MQRLRRLRADFWLLAALVTGSCQGRQVLSSHELRTHLLAAPVVYTARWAAFSMYLRNWDLAVPGSPSSSMLMSPLSRWVPPGDFSCTHQHVQMLVSVTHSGHDWSAGLSAHCGDYQVHAISRQEAYLAAKHGQCNALLDVAMAVD